MTSIGPGGTTKFKITAAISSALIAHTRYVSNLRLWDQFLIWRYTLGSGALNFTLIGIAKEEQQIYWVYNFFKSFNYDPKLIDRHFIMYINFFDDPKSLLLSKDRVDIALDVIEKVIKQIQQIILFAPKIKLPFDVYKVSGKYPELPDKLGVPPDNMSIVYQKPFNSTTYNPQFNFAPFIAEDASCCLHKITVGKDDRVLLIPSEFHSYPHEMECLLGFNSAFDIKEITTKTFDYIPKENQKFIPVQDINDLVIGQVFMVDPLSDNTVKSKELKYYVSELINPPRSN